jgi:flagellar protein FlaG
MSVINTNLGPRQPIKNPQQEAPKAVSVEEDKAVLETAQQNKPTEKVETTESLKAQNLAADAEQPKLIDEAVSKLKEYAKNMQRELNFEVHQESGDTVIKVFNANSGDLVRQMPSEEALKLAEMADSKSTGGLLDFLA